MKFAQEKPGEFQHLVADLGDYGVSKVALCGVKSNAWSSVTNLPIGEACPECKTAFDKGVRFEVNCEIKNEQDTNTDHET